MKTSNDELNEWLRSITRINKLGETLRSQTPAPTLKQSEFICYILDTDSAGCPVVSLHRGKMQNDRIERGRYSALSYTSRFFTDHATILQDIDRALIKDALQYGIIADGGRIGANNYRKDGLDALIRGMIHTGRMLFEDGGHDYLKWVDTIAISYKWEEEGDDDESLKLFLVDDGGNAISMVDVGTDRPLAVNIASGEVGEAILPLSGSVIMQLAQMPAIPRVQMPRVFQSLEAAGITILPKPPEADLLVRDDIIPTTTILVEGYWADPEQYIYDDYYSSRRQSAKRKPEYRCLARVSLDYFGREIEYYDDATITMDLDGRELIIIRNQALENAILEKIGRQIETIGLKETDSEYDDDDGVARFFETAMDRDDFTYLFLFSQFFKSCFDKIANVKVIFGENWPMRAYEGEFTLRPILRKRNNGKGKSDHQFEFDIELDAQGNTESVLDALIEVVNSLPITSLGVLPEDFDLQSFLGMNPIWHRMQSGEMIRLPADVVRPMVIALIAAHNLRGAIGPARAAEIAALVDASEGTVRFEGLEELVKLGRRLNALAGGVSSEEPPGFLGELREYQKQAYGWMCALAELEFGGCLADEMGLGKSVISIAYLVKRHLGGDAAGPSLIVGTASMVETWKQELERFAPGLKVAVLHGGDRLDLIDEMEDHDVAVTSYGVALRDIDVLKTIPWETVILDEAHNIRNRDSKTASMVRELGGDIRFTLTGTPVNNHLEDLWSLFDFSVPGLLGNRAAFKEQFRTPIEKLEDRRAQGRLNRMIQPFVLRRTKAEVADELPEKTVTIHPIVLGDAQRALYESTRIAMLAEVKRAISLKGVLESRATILTCLLRLRQICCDPRLLKEKDASAIGSAKLTRAIELIESSVLSGSRIVVFSQFVEMLIALSNELTKAKIGHFMFSGATNIKKRRDMVDRFQSGERPVFLISTKAGGEGITLTAADTVILYDVWWAPGAEQQAQDRIHRIGQDKPVFVHRLICEATVEEQILELQARKIALAEALWTGDQTGRGFSMTESEVLALFGDTEHTRHRPSHLFLPIE